MITKEQLTNITSIQQNVNSEQLLPYISIAEDLHLRPMLGEALYGDLRAAYDKQELDPRYTTLYAYVVPVLAYFAFYEYLPFSLYKFTNRGLEKRSGVESDSAELKEVNSLRAVIKGYADHYQNKMEAYLNDNLESFPMYKKSPKGTPEDRGNKGIGGIYFY